MCEVIDVVEKDGVYVPVRVFTPAERALMKRMWELGMAYEEEEPVVHPDFKGCIPKDLKVVV